MEICRNCRLYDTTGTGCAVLGDACCNKNIFEEVDGLAIYGCGCDLTLKGRSLSSACPLKKWDAIMTLQEEEMLKKQLNENKGERGVDNS